MASSLLAAILESSDEAMITKTLDGVITAWNSVAVSLFGYSAGEAVGMHISKIIPSDRVLEETEILQRLQRGLRMDRYETMRLRKDGSLVEISLIVIPIKSAEGKVIGALKIARDFTSCRLVQTDAREVLRLQSQFAQIAEAVPGVVHSFQMWPDGRACMPFATSRIEDLYGFPAEVLAKDFSPVYPRVHPDDRQILADSEQDAFRRQTNWHCKFRYDHPIKGDRWIEGWARPQLDARDSVLWHGFLMDVTEVEQAKLARQESENLARSVLESLTSQIAVVGEDGTILAVNQAWRGFGQAHGASGSFAEGSNYLDACASAYGHEREMANKVAQAIRDVAAGRLPMFEIEYRCDCGASRQWSRCRISPFVGDGTRRAVVSHFDITALKLTEEQLRFRERMLAQSQAMAHVGSWDLELTDMADLYANQPPRWSDECYRIFGYDPSKAEDTREIVFRAMDLENRNLIASAFERLIKDKIPFQIEHKIKKPDGTERVIEAWADILKPTESGFPRIIGTCQDITDRKEIEVALKKSADLLENLWRQLLRAQEDERRRIARELHDELGQALTALKINLQQMKGGSDEETRLNDSIEIVGQALQQVRGMALDLRPSILDDLGLVAALRWYVSRQAQRTGAIGRFIADPENLRLDPELETLCFRIAQGALTNMARHARAKTFRVELLQHSGTVQLNITDDGIGFDVETTLESVISGNSLGLAGMRERVEMVGGDIDFNSQPGAGTEIRMSFPTSPPHKVNGAMKPEESGR